MRFSGTTRRAVAALGVAAFLVAGCSSDDDMQSSDGGDDTAETTTAPQSSAFAEDNFGDACSGLPDSGPGSAEAMTMDPVATAASTNPQLTTLVAAVKAAGLVDTLNDAEALTVFAPVDDAFAALPDGTVDTLLEDPMGDLTDILTHHVVAERMSGADLIDAGTAETMQGGWVTITEDSGTMMVDDASVVCGNVQTANATVFLIDSVLMP